MWRRLFNAISSLNLTIICLCASILLVFAGTLAQVHNGIQIVQERYFQSWFVWWPPDATGLRFPIFPGGHLLGGILLINLVAAHIKRFKWTWRKLGIHIIHAGLVIMLLGGLFTDLLSVSSHVRLEEGETKNYSEDSERSELAVIDETDNELEQVTAIPQSRLKQAGVIEHASLPFQVIVRRYYQNSELRMIAKAATGTLPAAEHGVGAGVQVTELPRATAPKDRDLTSAILEMVPITKEGGAAGTSLGTWLVSDALGAPQSFTCAGRKWRLELRPARYYKPYSLTLQKFTHERYRGTEIAKNFASRVTLIDPDKKENREVLIYMNHPLRYQGDTYYQAGFDKSDKATVLQVVHNPGFAAPYVACVIMGAGLLLQFGFHLLAFSRRRRTEVTA